MRRKNHPICGCVSPPARRATRASHRHPMSAGLLVGDRRLLRSPHLPQHPVSSVPRVFRTPLPVPNARRRLLVLAGGLRSPGSHEGPRLCTCMILCDHTVSHEAATSVEDPPGRGRTTICIPSAPLWDPPGASDSRYICARWAAARRAQGSVWVGAAAAAAGHRSRVPRGFGKASRSQLLSS
ncbi:hypothetical protein OH76DRAFT_175841 [Lentinus brumalis]|uniref:Uncharacterized protein n=1 Tax=Lentinus brumalis TaxID=2498619 RepID=A0A371CNI9_9APHY|nr:hypothetical protein OH76DRAFT_175841 [Polyporus brumalis]